MAKVALVIGDTGTGKSTSIKTLDPKTTYIFNTLDKPLPFKGSGSIYNTENKNMYSTESYKTLITNIPKVTVALPHIKTIVIDDIGFIATNEFFARASEVGFTKFTEIGVHMQQIISAAKALPDDVAVFLMFHEDDDVSDKIKIGKKIKMIGALLEDKYNPLAIVSVALFTDVTFDKDGKAEYSFLTQRTSRKGQIIPAKSPDGMFDSVNIPNDLALVREAMFSYYN